MSAGKVPGPADAAAIDAAYGLEPLFEPSGHAVDSARGDGTALEQIQCPYCGEIIEILADVSAGAARYIEDCQICCRPIELSFKTDDDGAPTELLARCSD